MATVAARELRNHTARVLDRVAHGEQVTITVNGEPVADLVPTRSRRRRFMTRSEFLQIPLADPGLRDELEELAGQTLNELGPIE